MSGEMPGRIGGRFRDPRGSALRHVHTIRSGDAPACASRPRQLSSLMIRTSKHGRGLSAFIRGRSPSQPWRSRGPWRVRSAGSRSCILGHAGLVRGFASVDRRGHHRCHSALERPAGLQAGVRECLAGRRQFTLLTCSGATVRASTRPPSRLSYAQPFVFFNAGPRRSRVHDRVRVWLCAFTSNRRRPSCVLRCRSPSSALSRHAAAQDCRGCRPDRRNSPAAWSSTSTPTLRVVPRSLRRTSPTWEASTARASTPILMTIVLRLEDCVSSFRVAPGWRATVYEYPDYKGESS